MKKEHIKNVIMPTFEKMIKGNCFDAIDDIPSGIKLYDSNNGMKQAYADGIRTLKVTVESAIDRLLGEMKSAVDQETEIVDTAKAQAVNTLSS